MDYQPAIYYEIPNQVETPRFHLVKEYQLTLYYFESCPYCQKVLKYIKKNKLTIPMVNIRKEKGARETLIQIGGKGQVPCLIINGKALYESSDIIRWLQDHRNCLPKTRS